MQTESAPTSRLTSGAHGKISSKTPNVMHACRCRAAAVCRLWQQRLSERGPLSAAAVLPSNPGAGRAAQNKPLRTMQIESLQRWLRRHDPLVQQLQFDTSPVSSLRIGIAYGLQTCIRSICGRHTCIHVCGRKLFFEENRSVARRRQNMMVTL